MKGEAEDDGVTAVGMFYLADDFLRAARTVVSPRSLADGPARILAIHASELYLKAYLRRRGKTHEQLAATMHRLDEIAQAARMEGLDLSDEILARLADLWEAREYVTARYEMTEPRRSASRVLNLAAALRRRVRAALELSVPRL